MALTLEVAYADAAALAHDAATQLAQGGLYVAVDASALPPLAPLTLRLVQGGTAFVAAARLTVATGQAACVELDAGGREALLAALAQHLRGVTPQPGERQARVHDADAQPSHGLIVQTHNDNALHDANAQRLDGLIVQRHNDNAAHDANAQPSDGFIVQTQTDNAAHDADPQPSHGVVVQTHNDKSAHDANAQPLNGAIVQTHNCKSTHDANAQPLHGVIVQTHNDKSAHDANAQPLHGVIVQTHNDKSAHEANAQPRRDVIVQTHNDNAAHDADAQPSHVVIVQMHSDDAADNANAQRGDGDGDGKDAACDPGDAARARGTIPLDRRIAVMSVTEKIQLALHGNRDARALLLRDRAGVVQASLARNPKITLDEVQALARSPQLAPDAVEALAQHPSWGSAAGVVLALVRNPRTPLPAATALVARLIPSDLRVIAKGLGVRPQVAQAARKRMFERER